jgi:hypothetical protein
MSDTDAEASARLDNPRERLRVYLEGFRAGAAIAQVTENTSPDYSEGWRDGRHAFSAAVDKKRSALGLTKAAQLSPMERISLLTRPNDGRSGRCGIRMSGTNWCVLDVGHEGDHE